MGQASSVSVKADCDANNVTVVDKVVPVKKDGSGEKTKKKGALISPQPKKEAAADGEDKKPEEKKPEKKKAKEKKLPKESTVVLNISTNKKIIKKIEEVDDATGDNGKGLVTVKGTIDVKELVSCLIDRLKWDVEIVSAKKVDGGEKKDAKADGGAGGGEKKDKEAADKAEKGRKKKAVEKKPPKESTVVLNISTNKKISKKIEEVDDATGDNGKGLVTVKGTIDVKELVSCLIDRLKWDVEIVSAKKVDRGEKKDAKADGGAGGGEKKDKEAADKAEKGRNKNAVEKKPPKEQKEAPKNDDAKKDDGVVTFVLEMDCGSCAKKVKAAVEGYEGVQSVKTGCDTNKVTVVGKVNPVQVKERLKVQMKKTVGLIYPQPKKDAAAGGGDKKPKEKQTPKEPKKAPKNDGAKKDNVVLKMELRCEGCPKEVKVKVKY